MMDSWELNEQRLEESFFYWKLVLFYWEDGTLGDTDLYAPRCKSTQRRDIEMLCERAFTNVRTKTGRGNKGATLLLKEVKFLVDKFHCLKHTELVCMPLDNPKCVYHPDLPAFQEIHGTNTECAEQAFRWLGAFKNNCKKMRMHKYCFFLWIVVEAHNKRLEREMMRMGRSFTS